MSVATAESDPPISVRSIAREVLEEADGNWEKAARLFRLRLDKDSALYRAIVEPLIQGAIWQHIRSVAHSDRAHVWHRAPKPDRNIADGGQVRAARLVAARLMDFTLWGGRRLGDATRPELVEVIEKYESDAKANGERARWLTLVAERLKDDKTTVAKALKEKDLLALQKKAQGSN